MAQICRQCGRRGLFLKLNSDGLCKECEARNLRKDINEAKDFLAGFISHVQAATEQSVIFAGLGSSRIERIEKNCAYVREHIDDWRKIPHFFDAFMETLEKDERHSWYHSPLFPSRTIFPEHFTEEELDGCFEKLKSDVDKTYYDCLTAGSNAYDYSEVYHVVGVTFKNGRRSRQTILRQIRFKDPPYQFEPEFRLERYLFGDEPAVAVYADQEQVGNIPRDELNSLLSKWEDYLCVADYDIVGGGHGYSYGLQLRIGFRHHND